MNIDSRTTADEALTFDVDNDDSSQCIFFNLSIFTVRCSLAQIPLDEAEDPDAAHSQREHYLKSIWLRNLLFENPGSYPSLFNQVDAHSWREQFYTTSKVFPAQFRVAEISRVCLYLCLKDMIQFRLLSKACNQAAVIAFHENSAAFKPAIESFKIPAAFEIPSLEQKHLQ